MAGDRAAIERMPAGDSPVLALAFLALLATPGIVAAGDPVRLQLKWHHQFQFAGYYAAQARGYYAAEGLDVEILEGGSDRPPVATVLRGGADFGVSDADVLLARLKGEPLVVCAAIFQHSPYVIMSRRERGIRTPADLVGARVMLSDDQGSAQFRGMLVREGIDPGRVDIRPQSWDLADLIEGRVDAVSAYATVEPWLLRAKGVEPALLRSTDYGVDFYGDALFTTEAQVRSQPRRVAAFVRASLKGWSYALEHPEEIAALVSKMDGVAKRGMDREMLLHEAREMRPFILPDIVEIGHMNPGRWQRTGETLVALGMAPSTRRLDGFIHDPERRDAGLTRMLLWLGAATLLSTGLVVLWNLQMRGRVRERTRELHAEALQRRKAEVDLGESEARLEGAIESAMDAIVSVDHEQRIVLFNPAAERMFGCRREDAIGSPLDRFLPGQSRALQEAEVEPPGSAEAPSAAAGLRTVRGRRADGAEFPAEASIAGTRAAGKVVSTVILRDVTERERSQERLRQSEEKFSRAFQSSPDGLVLSRLSDGALEEVNEAFLKLSGYSREEALGRTSIELGLWVDPAVRDQYVAALKKDGTIRDRQFSFRGASGASRDCLVSAEVIDLDGKPFVLTTIRDVTEINRIQQRLVSIYDTVGDVLFLIAIGDDGGFRFESINKRFSATTGLPAAAVVGKRIEEVIPEASLPLALSRYREAIEGKAVVRWEQTTDFPAGRRSGEVSIAPIFDQGGRCTHLVGAVHDVTERKIAEERHARAEETLRQSQKLEGIGRLAGGIAHDFNNILGVILGYGELMRRQVAEDHPVRPRLEQVIQAAQRAAGLTRQLLAFSRKQVMQPKLLDLGEVVEDLRRMLERVVGEDLEIEVRGAEGLGAVNADPTQVEQVIMNLVVNARDAMPKGGHLTIETANAEFDEAYAAAHPPAQAGQFVMVAVSDTGVGMDAETQAHVFEPFFTTKPLGEGTGLGLATVYGIVKQMRGYVWVYSEVGHGTTFKVYLPRVADGVPAAPAVTAAAPLPRGQETVLVVEDSESLRDLIREVLEEQGYTVLSATQGEEALTLVRERTDTIDLLLTDVVMPKLGGGELVTKVRALRPEIRALYMSGYTGGTVTRQGVLEEGFRLLEKPFTGEQLTRAVRQALDA